jgi:MFS family permease
VGRALAPFLGGYILFATNKSFFTLYIAVGIAGVTAFVIALLFLSERKNFGAEPTSVDKVSGKMFGRWLTIIKNTQVLGISFVQAVQYFVFGSVEFFLVGYLIDVVKMDLFSVGIITGSEIVALVVARPLIGRISDRIGRTKPIVVGIVASVILVAAIPFTSQFLMLLLLAVAYGVSFAMVLSSTSPCVCDLVPASLVGASMGFLSTTMDIGQTLGPIVSGLIFATNLHYTGMFLFLSFLLVISILVFLLSKRQLKNI